MAKDNRPLTTEEELAATRKSLNELVVAMTRQAATLEQQTMELAKQGERLDQVVKMLRRTESQKKAAEREVRRLRKLLGLDDPDPEPSSEPMPEDHGEEHGALDGDADGAIASEDGTKASTDSSSSSAPQGPTAPKERRRGGGRRPPPAHLPTDVEHHAICDCAHCGARTLKQSTQTTRVYTVVPEHVRCREIRRETVLCTNPDCNKHTTAPMPPMPLARTLYDCRFIAWLVYMKFVLLIPLDRVRLMLAEQGVHIAMGSLVLLIKRASELADAVDGHHMRLLKSRPWMNFDGTGLKVLMPHQSVAWDGYLEVFVHGEVTVFQFDLTKYADGLAERIGDYTGTLVCDAEQRNAAGAQRATFAHCNAHAVRKFREAKKTWPKRAAQAGRFLKALYDLEELADEQQLYGPQRVAYRQRKSRRVLLRFRQWLEGFLKREDAPTDPLVKSAKYYLKHWDTLTLFVDNAGIPLDNNAAEREFQRHAKLRYASLFAGSEEGAHRWATLLGVVRTAQKCEVDVFGYLTWLFERRGSHKKQFDMPAAELTPMAYRAAGCPGAVVAA